MNIYWLLKAILILSKYENSYLLWSPVVWVALLQSRPQSTRGTRWWGRPLWGGAQSTTPSQAAVPFRYRHSTTLGSTLQGIYLVKINNIIIKKICFPKILKTKQKLINIWLPLHLVSFLHIWIILRYESGYSTIPFIAHFI